MSEYARYFVLLLTERTDNAESSNRSICEAILCLCLKHSWLEIRIVSIATLSLAAIVALIFLRICTQTLSHKVNIQSIYVLYQTSDWWQKLLWDIPLNVWLLFATWGHYFIKSKGFLLELRSWGRLLIFFFIFWLLANDIWNEISNELWLCFPLSYLTISDNYMWEWLNIRIFRWSSCQLLSNHVQC